MFELQTSFHFNVVCNNNFKMQCHSSLIYLCVESTQLMVSAFDTTTLYNSAIEMVIRLLLVKLVCPNFQVFRNQYIYLAGKLVCIICIICIAYTCIHCTGKFIFYSVLIYMNISIHFCIFISIT